MVTAAYYPVNDTTLPEAERAYLRQLEGFAAQQDLSQDVRGEVRALSVAFSILAAVVVGLRFFARHLQRAPYGIDDWLILCSLALLGANLAFNMVMVGQGLGLHSGRLTIGELERLDETVVGAEVVYTTAVNMYKISLLFLYFRIFPVPSVRKWGCYCGGVSTAWNVACIFAASFQCTPRNKIWEPWVDGFCIDLFLAQLCISVPSILCDVVILCLPLPHILRLRTNLTQKVCLVAIFMLGSYVVFTSIYRFVVYLDYSRQDVPYTLALPCAWNIIEISSGIVSSCLPTLGPIVRPVLKSVMPSSLSRSTGASYGKRRADSNPHLVTIGGGGNSRQSKMRWNQWGMPQHRLADDDSDHHLHYGITGADIEMGPRTTVTAARATDRARDSMGGSGKSGAGGSGGGDAASGGGGGAASSRAGDSRDSDEFPIMGGISKKTQVQWTVESVSDSKSG